MIIPKLKLVRAVVSNFADWCQPSARHTMKMLLAETETHNWKQAIAKLSTLTSLDLSDRQISNIQPLSKLTNLTYLDLSDNQINDIKPLLKLTNLTYLDLGRNQIVDIRPLSQLTNLKQLYLWGNPIPNQAISSNYKTISQMKVRLRTTMG
jgi:internalin A